jgi:hypothetical protein
MLGRIAAIVLLLGLTGCDVPAPGWNMIGFQPARVEPRIAGTANEHCRAVADQRAQDGAMNGLDQQAQDDVFNGTYSRCSAYEAAHGPG